MPIETLIALTGFAIIASFTPGPNNALIAASGVNFGYRRSLPHILGIAFGYAFMIFVVGLFLGQVFQKSLLLREALRWLGIILLIYVAYKIATAGGLSQADGRARPFRFYEAAGFQWVNPKGWAMAIAITSQFIDPAAPIESSLTVAFIFICAGIASASLWAWLGSHIATRPSGPERTIWFNRLLGLLVFSFVFILLLT